MNADVSNIKYVDIVYEVLTRWYAKFAATSPKLILGIVVFLLVLLMSSFLSKISVKILNRFFPQSKLQSNVVALIGIFRFLIILGGAFITFEIMGLGGFVMKFLGSLGVAGIIAGVALKDLVSSIFSGVLVGIDKSFKEGDLVQISSVKGTVEEIGFLTTKIIAEDGKKVYLPNQLIFSSPFINYTASNSRKIFIDIEIPNTEDLAKTKEVILDEVKDFAFTDLSKTFQVVLLKQNLGIFTVEAQLWIKHGSNIAAARSEALLKIKQRLDSEGISLVNPNTNQPS